MTTRRPAPPAAPPASWRVSFHGGHSSDFCEHAHSPLRAMLDEAVRQGFVAYGITEHAPRLDPRFLYPSEVEAGISPEDLAARFERYAAALPALQRDYAGRLDVLRGFEADVVPPGTWHDVMTDLKERHDFDYLVGSVHWLDDDLILSTRRAPFDHALAAHGGLEGLLLRYYADVAAMVERLRPHILGHLDVITRHGATVGPVDGPAVRSAVGVVLEAARAAGSIIDVNLGAYRRGQSHPYPAPWIVREARRMGLRFTFGDDAHSVAEVGAGLDDARLWLLDLGVDTVTVLARSPGGPLRRDEVPLR